MIEKNPQTKIDLGMILWGVKLQAQFSEDGFTPLMVAIINGDRQGVWTLLVQGANPAIVSRNSLYITALHLLAGLGDEALLEAALALVTNCDLKRFDGRTPLHEAVTANQLAAVRTLINAGANPFAPDNLGITPIFLAHQLGNRGIITLLLPETN